MQVRNRKTGWRGRVTAVLTGCCAAGMIALGIGGCGTGHMTWSCKWWTAEVKADRAPVIDVPNGTSRQDVIMQQVMAAQLRSDERSQARACSS
jgi:hypothetical protein